MGSKKPNIKAQRKKQERKKAAQAKKRQQRRPFTIILVILIVAAGLYGIITLLQQQESALAGDHVAELPPNHMSSGCIPRYDTTPPTSGCHQDSWERRWGVHESPIVPETQVHNLEHGGVLVQYRQEAIPGLSNDYIEDLTLFIEELRENNRYCKVILAPYPDLPQTIALTAWGWIQTFEDYDQTEVRKFIDDHLGKRGGEASLPCN